MRRRVSSMTRRPALRLVAAAALVVLGACAQADDAREVAAPGAEPATEPAVVRVYTSVTQDSVDAVVGGFEAAHDATVEVFRAPTGELNARIAAERREGAIQADVFWLSDPLSMQEFDAEGLLRDWTPGNVDAVEAPLRSERFFGTRLLNLVIVAREDLAATPSSWWDLTDAAYEGAVAIPDPGFAGTAFGALGYFALADDFGFAYYEALADNGVVQVNAPGEVVAGVAEGRFDAGMTIDATAREAIADGSPLELVWPEPGAIVVYSPIAVLDTAGDSGPAEAFVEHVLSPEAQAAMADTGWQPVSPDADWPHAVGPTVSPDWDAAFDQQAELLERYRAIIGG
jgi:iron(III) transport system substrate-binding protein